MNVVIGSDHGGYDLKTHLVSKLERQGHQVEDLGCHSSESVDYPDFAEQVCKRVIDDQNTLGILICGTGIGMSLAANRNYEIRAALCHDEFSAQMSREHNNANILCLGARVIGTGLAESIVDAWLNSSFSGGRHQIRIDKFSK
jgi:ribose 5-phosphate isomerase B